MATSRRVDSSQMAGRLAGVIQCLLALACCSAVCGELLDLTYTFDESTHYWQRRQIFNHTEVFVGLSENGFWYESFNYSANEHGGTHLDAPAHFFDGGWTAEQIPADRLIANAAVVDMTERSRLDPDAVLTKSDLDSWRRVHGPFRYPSVVLLRTGYAAFWHNRSLYFGEVPDQPDKRRFPGFGKSAATDLSKDPAVVGVGIDTASIDPGNSELFPAHVQLFSTNRFALENVGDMGGIPATGARIFALPMKIGGGSGAPCRVVVELPKPTPPRGRGRGASRKGNGPH